MSHEEDCACHDCLKKRVDEVELKGDDPVHDFLRILTKVAKKRPPVGNKPEE